jgi:hypothetical protein
LEPGDQDKLYFRIIEMKFGSGISKSLNCRYKRP